MIATDSTGCTSNSDSLEINAGNAPFVPEIDDLVHCAGEDFSILIPVNDSVFWLGSGQAFYANPFEITTLNEDTILYFYIVSSDGCASPIQSFNVQVIDGAFIPTIFGLDSICAGDSLNLFTTIIPNAVYQWFVNNEIYSTNNQLTIPETFSLSNPTSITLNVIIGDCAAGQQSTTVQISPTPPSLNIIGENNVCENQSVLLHTVSDNELNISWQWFNNLSNNDTIQFNLNPGDSVLVLLTSMLNGCTSIPTELWVYAHNNPQITNVVSNSPVCEGESIYIDFEMTNETFATILSPNGIIFETNALQIPNTNLNDGGLYLIESNNMYCNAIDSLNIQIFPSPSVELGDEITICAGETHFFSINDYEIVIWNSNIISNNYETNQNEMVTVSVVNDYGCSYSDSVLVNSQECDGEISNIFTPNGDGVNDVFNFNQYDYRDLQVFIYNRWGQLICKLNNIDYWDGTNCKSGLKVSDGTYFYVMNYITTPGATGMKKGYIQVSR